MIRKFLLGIGVMALSFVMVMPIAGVANVNASVVQSEETVDPCNTYVWVYKEENGKKYMRLWDKMLLRWVTDWILVE